MDIKESVKKYLEEQPKFRERKNKDKGMAHLLVRRYCLQRQVAEGAISLETLTAILQDYASMDRVWRKTLEEFVELRGTDYDAKDDLESKKLGELGYPVKKVEPIRESVQGSIPI